MVPSLTLCMRPKTKDPLSERGVRLYGEIRILYEENHLSLSSLGGVQAFLTQKLRMTELSSHSSLSVTDFHRTFHSPFPTFYKHFKL